MSEDSKEEASESSEKPAFLPGYNNVEAFTKDGFKTLMEAIRHSNVLPTGRDWNFYKTSDSFKKIMHDEGTNILQMMNKIMHCNDLDYNIKNRILEEKTELVVEANDIILEKVANNIDEMNGVRKSIQEPIIIQTVSTQLPVNGSWNRTATVSTVAANSTATSLAEKNCIKLITAKNIIRPQKFFKDRIENDNKYPWCPRITEKPNSLKPLAIFLEQYENREEYSHPYEYELERFAPTTEQLEEETPEFPKPLEETPLIEIDKPEQLDDLVETLRQCKEFAVDLEHHSYRSFMGFTCLLQISTKDKDYIIDTLALRDKLYILNEVFTKNNIVKIFHGADKDVEWLQRDLSIYVVNMFDTHQAAKVLEYSGLSLAFLMKKFCNILPNKQFQLADWRIRPLLEEFKTYAREDTHYLIYIYKMLKKDLLLKGKKSDHILRSVIDRSTEICKKRYFKPLLREDSHLDIYRRCKKMFDNRQMYALTEIYAWRDNLARMEDESLGYVLPSHMLLQISETLPREMQGILACCNPVPPLVRSNLLELHQIILRARDQPLEKAILKEVTSGRGVLKKISKINIDHGLHCPHDLSKGNEFRDDLPTLLTNNDIKKEFITLVNNKLTIEKKSCYSIFDCISGFYNERKTLKKNHGNNYLSPYERYKLVKPFVEAEEQAQKEKEENIIEKQTEELIADEERTDSDRIASIRSHFMQLSKKFSEELAEKKKQEEVEQQRSLIEMGGTRKRKRDFDDSYETPMVSNDLHTPMPSFKRPRFRNRNRKRGKKRKFDQVNSDSNDYIQETNDNNERQNNGKRKRNRNQQEQGQIWDDSNKANVPKTTNNRKNKQNKNAQQQNRQHQQQNKQNHNNKRKQKQNDFNVMPFDYVSVDFRQFQGGGGSADSGVNIKNTLKGKQSKKMGNKGTKSAVFNNGKSNRGGKQGQSRGRGRASGRGRGK